MERIDIRNMERVPRRYNLPHQQVCVKNGRCLCDHETGVCASLHIAAGGRARDVDQAVLFAVEVRAAVEEQKLLVFRSKSGEASSQQQDEEQVKIPQKKTAGSRKAARKTGITSEE